MALRIYRQGVGQAVDAFRLAAISGLFTTALSVVATLALVLLGPPLH